MVNQPAGRGNHHARFAAQIRILLMQIVPADDQRGFKRVLGVGKFFKLGIRLLRQFARGRQNKRVLFRPFGQTRGQRQ